MEVASAGHVRAVSILRGLVVLRNCMLYRHCSVEKTLVVELLDSPGSVSSRGKDNKGNPGFRIGGMKLHRDAVVDVSAKYIGNVRISVVPPLEILKELSQCHFVGITG
ncbi:hypothetical protein AC578_10510 [Pseudocercospora eumusae]|uniref:Uncharacterized protein n=1 Tax=Pseudocercospora eumusae TaxID=321146 RepID=A0A139H8D7_9PEZI|nr:hypothetical protein AC578_10510 [Pseudocercospora eumusae]